MSRFLRPQQGLGWLDQRMPRQVLLSGPTPLTRWVDASPGEFWIKRDDLSHPLYGGNKVRKLEYILAHALNKGVQRIVTFGGLGTHHGVATTIFGRTLGLATTVILFDQPRTQVVEESLALLQNWGAELWFRGSLTRTLLSYALESRLRHPQAMRLFAGGSSIEGGQAFVRAAFELGLQVEQGLMSRPDRLVVAVGSSATVAGLATGCALMGWSTRVTGIRVAPARLGFFDACTLATVRKQANALSQYWLSWGAPRHQLCIDWDDDEFGLGYGLSTPQGTDAEQLFRSQLGVPLDPTYTAKAFAGALKWRAQRPDETLLYWHSLSSVPFEQILYQPISARIPSLSLDSTLFRGGQGGKFS